MADNSGQIVRRTAFQDVRISERVHSGAFLPRHAHDSLQLCLVLEGEFVEEFDALPLHCVRSSLIVRPPLALHQDTFQGGTVHTLLIEYLRGARFGSLFEAAPAPAALLSATSAVLAREAWRELRATDLASPSALEGAVLRLAGETIRLLARPRERWLEHVKRSIDERLPRRVDVRELAAELRVSRSHLFESFRRGEGKTIGEYVTLRRVEQARELLAGQDRSLSEIAALCGFADQSHFTRTFRDQCGETPARFRRRSFRAWNRE